MEEVGFNPHGWLWGVWDLTKKKKKGTIDAVEIERELKLEPEDETELPQPLDKTWRIRSCILSMCKESGFLR